VDVLPWRVLAAVLAHSDPFVRPKKPPEKLDPRPIATTGRPNRNGAVLPDAPPRVVARVGAISHVLRPPGASSVLPPEATPDLRPAPSALLEPATVLEGRARATLDPQARSVRLAPASHHEVRVTVTRALLVLIARMRTDRRDATDHAPEQLDRRGLGIVRPRHLRRSNASVKTPAIRLAAKAGGASPVKAPSTSPVPVKSWVTRRASHERPNRHPPGSG
jgi:hypothetical protein